MMPPTEPTDRHPWRGLYIREGDQIVEAGAEDVAVAQAYSQWPHKGPLIDGRRITIMAKQQSYRVNEEVRIIHVLEAVLPGTEIYVMGPKAIVGEYVNGQLQGKDVVGDRTDPFQPEDYDGRVLSGPATDFNFDITVYTFRPPGVYRIVWQPGQWTSNILAIEVHA